MLLPRDSSHYRFRRLRFDIPSLRDLGRRLNANTKWFDMGLGKESTRHPLAGSPQLTAGSSLRQSPTIRTVGVRVKGRLEKRSNLSRNGNAPIRSRSVSCLERPSGPAASSGAPTSAGSQTPAFQPEI